MKPSDYVKRGWCRGASAKDALGIVVDPTSSHAIQWCTYGAICAAYPEDPEKRSGVVSRLSEKVTGMIPEWNDAPGRTQRQVVALLESIGE